MSFNLSNIEAIVEEAIDNWYIKEVLGANLRKSRVSAAPKREHPKRTRRMVKVTD